jgi:hypothetical protein
MSEIAKHWIDGEWVGSETVSESVNPPRSRSSPKPRPWSTPFRRSRPEQRGADLNDRVIGILSL